MSAFGTKQTLRDRFCAPTMCHGQPLAASADSPSQSKIDIGFDLRRGSTMNSIPQESLMLTGDENIVDVDFSVLWKVKPGHVGDFLFNVQQPEGTVKAVAESAMREVIGRSDGFRVGQASRTNPDTLPRKRSATWRSLHDRRHC